MRLTGELPTSSAPKHAHVKKEKSRREEHAETTHAPKMKSAFQMALESAMQKDDSSKDEPSEK